MSDKTSDNEESSRIHHHNTPFTHCPVEVLCERIEDEVLHDENSPRPKRLVYQKHDKHTGCIGGGGGSSLERGGGGGGAPKNKRLAFLQALLLLSFSTLLRSHTAGAESTSTLQQDHTPKLVPTVQQQKRLDEVQNNQNANDAVVEHNERNVLSSSSSNSMEFAENEMSEDDLFEVEDGTNEETDSSEGGREEEQEVEDDGVIVVATVDGTLAGLSRSSGQLLWKRSPQHQEKRQQMNNSRNPYMTMKKKSREKLQEEVEREYSLEPLVSTTTTVDTSRDQWRTAAVPSILDGKVYLTAADVTVTTTAKELVARAPFADRRGRIYTGTSVSTAVAFDGNTGEILQVIGGANKSNKNKSFTTNDDDTINNADDVESQRRNIIWIGRTDYSVTISEPRSGEVDVHFTTTEMMSAKQMVLGSGGGEGSNVDPNQVIHEDRNKGIFQMERISPLSEDSDTSLAAATASSSWTPISTDESKKQNEKQYSGTPIATASVVITPNGHLAYRDSDSGDILWVAEELFDTPVAFCMDGITGSSCQVETVPDGVLPDASPDYVSREMKRQLSMLKQQHKEGSSNQRKPSAGAGDDIESEPATIVSYLPGSGQLYAIPLVKEDIDSGAANDDRNPDNNLHHQQQRISSSTTVSQSKQQMQHQTSEYVSQHQKNTGLHQHANFHPHTNTENRNNNHHGHHHHHGQNTLVGGNKQQGCNSRSPYFPSCLIGSGTVNHYGHSKTQDKWDSLSRGSVGVDGNGYASFLSSSDTTRGEEGNSFSRVGSRDSFSSEANVDLDRNGVVVPFFRHVDYSHMGSADRQQHEDQYYYLLNSHLYREQQKSLATAPKNYERVFRILGSWLPPTIALLFVVSFELGRRKRQKDNDAKVEVDDSNEIEPLKANTSEEKRLTKENGIIEVIEDSILGYGGHGTIVYKGLLDGRYVAVKRMLKTYHASADREISLLIESDGHPNVVRYFLKEIRGDFVYLALELCDLSLQDLIAIIRKHFDQVEQENFGGMKKSAVFKATKNILFQIASGVRHLHHLRIVHRDLKPANILLADPRKKKSTEKNTSDEKSIYNKFEEGLYIAKISDMGLGKQLMGQSSYGVSLLNDASLRGQSNGGASSVIGAKGTVGWQAPEVMALRAPTDASLKSEGSNGHSEMTDSPSPIDACLQSGRTSRSVDIFSLGCIFYSTLVPGSHPFGEWYEREANIMHNKPNIESLIKISPEAHDLIEAMLRRNPKSRPTAKQICQHPFFWTPDQKLSFLCEFSDRIEIKSADTTETGASSFVAQLLSVERNASQIVGRAWDQTLDDELVNNVQRFRTYDASSVRDLLRLIRNKHHHFDELPKEFRERIGSNCSGLMEYFEVRFPKLLIHCFNTCREVLPSYDALLLKYSIEVVKTSNKISTIPENNMEEQAGTASSCDQESNHNPSSHPINVGLRSRKEPEDYPSCEVELSPVPEDVTVDAIASAAKTPPRNILSDGTDDCELIIWQGSNAAKVLNCRGWNRSDDDWERRVDVGSRKKESNLVRCAEDPKFRTRLCNHWDVSFGTFCPMRNKNKCIFAHGPIELRVKEGKRNRWGKLVDKDGNCNNPKHSGGEDTYGAARSIETERKQEGKWNTGKPSQPKKKKTPQKKEKTISNSLEK